MNMRLQLWDTAGQERYRCLVPSYLRNAHCVVLVFDLLCKPLYYVAEESLDGLRAWIDLAHQHIPAGSVMMMAGTKLDLVDKQQMNIERIKNAANGYGVDYVLVSSKTGEGVE